LQLRWHVVSCVEQFVWHVVGFDVVPAVVIDGMRVVPLIVLMQVFWQLCTWVLQPNMQVCDDAVGLGKMLGAGAGFVSSVPAVVWSVVCASAGAKPAIAGNASTSAATAARRKRRKAVRRRGTVDIMSSPHP
jgi:hypothetical protein